MALSPHNWAGQRIPLHATSEGKILLAYLSEAELAGHLTPPLARFTDRTIADIHGFSPGGPASDATPAPSASGPSSGGLAATSATTTMWQRCRWNSSNVASLLLDRGLFRGRAAGGRCGATPVARVLQTRSVRGN